MAAFAESTFSHASYAAFRPSYPRSLYDTVLKFHHDKKRLVVDLGCGTGTVTRTMSAHFDRCIGVDPSSGMIKQAQTQSESFKNISFLDGNAEAVLDTFDANSVDCVVAGQAAHWFDFDKLWPVLERVVRPGGTVAFWGYKDHVFVDFPAATDIMQDYAYSEDKHKLGPYWSQPGRSYVQDKLRFIQPPKAWDDVTRIEYEPATSGPHSGTGILFMEKQLTVGQCKNYIRTWSAYHGWSEKHPEQTSRSTAGNGDVVDELFDEIANKNSMFANEDASVNIEWGSGLIMARRQS